MAVNSEHVSQSLVSILIVILFSAVVLTLLLRPIAVSPDTKEILLILLGVLGTQFGQVVSYHLGSSASSRSKDVTISQMQNATSTTNAGPVTPAGN